MEPGGSMAQAAGPERGEGAPSRARTTARALAASGLVRGASRGLDLGRLRDDFAAGLRGCVRREIEERRLFPWLAVAFGGGILLAFAADGPPSVWPALVLGTLACGAAFAAWARFGLFMALLAASALFLGFAAALLRIEALRAPVLSRTSVAKLTGFVESIEPRGAGGGRIVVRVVSIGALPEAERPERIRVVVKSLAGLVPGQRVEGTARLLPPPEAARPGGYDFARDAYFRGIGAVGSVSGSLKPTAGEGPDRSLRFAAAIDAARNALTERIAGAIGGQAGAVSAALVTGKRGLIDEATNDILRAAGIYHVVSISGLHMVLAAGVFFWLTRALLALSPALALGWPIKKIAAIVGMAGASAYCIFSGAEVATERSLVMILVMQGAILFDRPALSLRNLALSALVVLAREPEALLGPSFQMSYGAVAGLIALAEALRRWRRPGEPGDPLRRAGLWLGALVLGTIGTTLVATIATAPFGTFHFHALQPYALIGNAATLPLVSFAVMPAAVLGTLMLPFGLDRWVWILMGWAVEAVLGLSAWVASFPNSTVLAPAFGTGALLLFSLALLLATLPVSRLRLLALAPLLAGLLLAARAERPEILAARDGSGAAIRGADGRLVLLGSVASFTATQWLRADGDSRDPKDPTLRRGVSCDRIGCTARLTDGRAVSYLSDRRGFAEDCRRAAVIVSRLAAPPGCAALLILDRDRLAAQGATSLRAGSGPGGFVMETVRRPGETRPWLPPRAAASRPAPSAPAEAGPSLPAPEDEVEP